MMRSSTGSSGSGGSIGGVGGRGTINAASCQDCGNKSKRDCQHNRCRTCCKTRGLHCPTHVRSTWIPVARRRLRHHHQNLLHHQMLRTLPAAAAAAAASDYPILSLPLSLSRTTNTNSTPSSGVEGRNFPAEVNLPARFQCIRVSSEHNEMDQFAYQTSINIKGHIFKGILYDQGPTTTNPGDTSSASTSNTGNHHHHHHHQFDFTSTMAAAPPPHNSSSSGGGAPNFHNQTSAPPFMNAFLPGMQFFPFPRP